MADCAFCSIIAGDVPAHVVLDDDVALAFLDVRPVFHGHVLVVPRTHFETLPDLPAADIGSYFDRVQRTATAVRDAMHAQGTFVAINNTVSQSVPHLHTHVVPRTKGDGSRGSSGRVPATRMTPTRPRSRPPSPLRSSDGH